MIHGMNHFTITAEDRAQTLDFYCGLLGLTQGHRPDLGFPDAWLYAGGRTEAVLCLEPVDPEVDPGPLLFELRSRLERFAATRLVDRVEVVGTLPVDRRHNAKIDRPAIAASLAAAAG